MVAHCRKLIGWKAFIENKFAQQRWARKLIGGKWEKRQVDIGMLGIRIVWVPVNEFEQDVRTSRWGAVLDEESY